MDGFKTCEVGTSSSRWGKGLVLTLLVLVTVAVSLFPAARDFVRHPSRIASAIHGMGWAGPVAFVSLTVLLVAAGVPRLLLYAAGGMAFGFWPGLLWGHIGAVLGAYGSFLAMRWAGRDAILRFCPWLRPYEERMTRGGIVTVLLVRQLPITGIWINGLLALTRVTHAQFLAGSAIGALPQGVPAALIGAGVASDSLGAVARYAAAALVIMVLGALVLRRFLHAAGAAVAPASSGNVE